MEEALLSSWQIFKVIVAISGTFFTVLGILTVFYWIKPAGEPNDSSNRINNIMSWWIGMTRPEVMGETYKAFRQDVMENIEDIQNRDSE